MMAGVIRKRGIDWTVETAIKFCSWAALDVSGTGFGPAVQDEGLGGRFGPGRDTHGGNLSAESLRDIHPGVRGQG